MVVPYFTREEVAWSVVQVIVAEVLVTPVDATAEITGVPTEPVVVKVALLELEDTLDALAETTSKL